MAATVRALAPEYRLVYFGDAARRPYGPLPGDVVTGYVAQAEALFHREGCDVWVIACNTASVVADRALKGLLPCIDMVSAAAAAAPDPAEGPVGVLATAGTVASGVIARALPEHDVHQVATEELLRLAEEGASADPRIPALTAAAVAELQAAGCTSAILACTDFTCVLPQMRAAAGGIRLIDPLDAAAAMAVATLRDLDPGLDRTELPDKLYLSGPHPTDIVEFARDRFGLDLPPVEYVDIDSFNQLPEGARSL